jgi:hypothetical protein
MNSREILSLRAELCRIGLVTKELDITQAGMLMGAITALGVVTGKNTEEELMKMFNIKPLNERSLPREVEGHGS